MNFNLIIIFFASCILCISLVVLLYLHMNKLLHFFDTNVVKKVIKPKVNKDVVAHKQNWKCAHCQGIMLSQFQITTQNNQHFAICINCSSEYNCLDNTCLV